MAAADIRLVAAALAGIVLAIFLIVRGRLHPFVALLCGAFVIGPLGGLSPGETAKAVQKGAGDILGGTGLVVALGLALGTMLQLSDGASGLARLMIGDARSRRAPWMCLSVAMIIGLPLFFETGLVLLLPIISSAALALPDDSRRDGLKLRLMLSALTGLSVLHALVPPHPGPLIAINALGADLGKTIAFGLLIAVPTAIAAGPLLSLATARGAALSVAATVPRAVLDRPASVGRALAAVLLPVALIVVGQAESLLPAGVADGLAWLSAVGNPVLAMLLACLAALPLLFGRRMLETKVQRSLWGETMAQSGTILLAIGAGGALKQVLVSAGVSDLIARLAISGALSPVLLGWSIAVAIRLATGSATVATITAAGIMTGAIAGSSVSPEWIVLAIGAGSVFFSHVNDPGFWLVKSYLGSDTPTTFRTWSLLETAISVLGLILVLAFSHML
jgi:GntP family gluconate:H+ symporter